MGDAARRGGGSGLVGRSNFECKHLLCHVKKLRIAIGAKINACENVMQRLGIAEKGGVESQMQCGNRAALPAILNAILLERPILNPCVACII